MKYYTIATTEEFDEWHMEQISKSKLQIDSRLLKIQDENHFGLIKDLEDELIRTEVEEWPTYLLCIFRKRKYFTFVRRK
jgi:hypothetical protein